MRCFRTLSSSMTQENYRTPWKKRRIGVLSASITMQHLASWRSRQTAVDLTHLEDICLCQPVGDSRRLHRGYLPPERTQRLTTRQNSNPSGLHELPYFTSEGRHTRPIMILTSLYPSPHPPPERFHGWRRLEEH